MLFISDFLIPTSKFLLPLSFDLSSDFCLLTSVIYLLISVI